MISGNDVLPFGENAAVPWLDATLFDESLRQGLRRFGAVPWHNPYLDGGVLTGAHPRDGSLSPVTWALLPFGALTAVKIKTWLALVAGLTGAYLLGRGAGATRRAATIAALLIPATAFTQEHLTAAPLDLGILFVLPAVALLCYGRAGLGTAFTAAGLIVLASFESGSLIFAALPAAGITALARAGPPAGATPPGCFYSRCFSLLCSAPCAGFPRWKCCRPRRIALLWA
ncbi:MAG: hypothetical protein M5R36_05200 [Deltaproteobacteria bacterium]|nr:hypothetical protein [Deltaproteobacteria bacterium]